MQRASSFSLFQNHNLLVSSQATNLMCWKRISRINPLYKFTDLQHLFFSLKYFSLFTYSLSGSYSLYFYHLHCHLLKIFPFSSTLQRQRIRIVCSSKYAVIPHIVLQKFKSEKPFSFPERGFPNVSSLGLSLRTGFNDLQEPGLSSFAIGFICDTRCPQLLGK